MNWNDDAQMRIQLRNINELQEIRIRQLTQSDLDAQKRIEQLEEALRKVDRLLEDNCPIRAGEVIHAALNPKAGE